MTISKSSMAQDIFSTLLSTFGSITNPQGGSKWIFSTYPERKTESKDDYPIILIHPAELSDWRSFTQTKKKVHISMPIEVIDSSLGPNDDTYGADYYYDEIWNTLETNRPTFREQTITMLNIIDSGHEVFERGKLKLHSRILTIEFDLTFSSTGVY